MFVQRVGQKLWSLLQPPIAGPMLIGGSLYVHSSYVFYACTHMYVCMYSMTNLQHKVSICSTLSTWENQSDLSTCKI